MSDISEEAMGGLIEAQRLTAGPIEPISMENCGGCKFFRAGQEQGQCFRYPPTVLLTKVEKDDPEKISWAGVWPAVNPDMYCGEFKSRLVI